jgi:hypothetical protein
MDPIYNVDFNRLLKWLVPPLLRSNLILNWLKAIISPIYWVYNNFIQYKSDVDYRTAITPQVCYLEKVLNDTFDKVRRRITISDNPGKNIVLIHMDDAALPVKIHQEGSGHDAVTLLIHDESSYVNLSDFIVRVPLTLQQSQRYRLQTILNTYKLASKRYKIIYR